MVEAEKDIPGRRNSLSKGLELRIGCAQSLSCFPFYLEDKRTRLWALLSSGLCSLTFLSQCRHKATVTVSAV